MRLVPASLSNNDKQVMLVSSGQNTVFFVQFRRRHRNFRRRWTAGVRTGGAALIPFFAGRLTLVVLLVGVDTGGW